MGGRTWNWGGAALLLVNAATIWVWTSVFLNATFVLAMLGAALLIAAAALSRRGGRAPLLGLSLSNLLAAVCVLALEAVLWIAPDVLCGQIANAAYSRYHGWSGGMYEGDAHAGQILRPHRRFPAYFNGHWWRHQSNASGYRGPLLGRADAVFLGDSMIYGHGVETNETVPARYEAILGHRSANLGQQGTCLLQALVRFERLAVPLRPKTVFVYCHPNDPYEATYWYPEDEVRRFIDLGPRSDRLPVARAKYHPAPWWRIDRLWNDHVRLPLRSAGAVHWAIKNGRKELLARLRETPPRAPVSRHGPFGPDAPFSLSPAEELGWTANAVALERLKRRCDEIGADLVVFDMGTPRGFSLRIEALADSIGATYSPAGRVALERCLEGEAVYLENDGHWTARGCQVVAEALARRYPAPGGRRAAPALLAN